MSQRFMQIIVVAFAAISFSGCRVVEGIFKAGVGVGIFIAVLVVGLIFFLVSRARA